jgi:hypothetical protein
MTLQPWQPAKGRPTIIGELSGTQRVPFGLDLQPRPSGLGV